MKLVEENLGKASVTCEDQHDSKREYTRNSIVNDTELGMSFISKLPVPVGVPLTDKRFWQWISGIDRAIMIDYNTFKKQMQQRYDDLEKYYHRQVEDLQQKLTSIITTSELGVCLSNRFGDDENIGVSQATLTRVVNQIMNRIAEATGELPDGVNIQITPDYVLSDSDSPIAIMCSAGDGIFESIKIYKNDELIIEKEDVQSFTEETTISDTTEFKVVATMLGMTYNSSKTIEKYYPFFIGSGSDWESVLKTENLRKYTGDIDGKYNIDVEKANDRIFIIIPTSIQEQYVKADMSGFEIPFNVINDERYIIYESRNKYDKGVYQINIV